MDAEEFRQEALRILEAFEVRYVDFQTEPFLPYRHRGIGAVTRFDERVIYIDRSLPQQEELLSWLHELLSIYYYLEEGYIRHDDEVEAEARALMRDSTFRDLLQDLVRSRKATASMW